MNEKERTELLKDISVMEAKITAMRDKAEAKEQRFYVGQPVLVWMDDSPQRKFKRYYNHAGEGSGHEAFHNAATPWSSHKCSVWDNAIPDPTAPSLINWIEWGGDINLPAGLDEDDLVMVMERDGEIGCGPADTHFWHHTDNPGSNIVCYAVIMPPVFK